jgi:hypothetical protein
LRDIPVIALVASVCGAESCVDLAEFADVRDSLLMELPNLKSELPCHGTCRRDVPAARPRRPRRALEALNYLGYLGAAGETACSTSDGKTLRRSFDRAAALSAARRLRLRHRRAGRHRPAGAITYSIFRTFAERGGSYQDS